MMDFSDLHMILILALGVGVGNMLSYCVMAFIGVIYETRKKGNR